MTREEFYTEYTIGRPNPRTGEIRDLRDYWYACEIWTTMTEEERAACTPEQMDKYIADTYLAIEEMEN